VFGLVNGFIDPLYTRLGSASNYSAIANLHTLKITTAHAKLSESSLEVFWQRILAVEILKLPALRSYLVIAARAEFNPSHSSTRISPSLLSLTCRAQLNCQPSTNWVPGWRPFHTNLLVFPSQADFQLTIEMVNLIVFKITPRRGPQRNRCSSIVARVFISAGTCLPSHCLETGCITLFCCCVRVCCGRYLPTVAVYRVAAKQRV
jgi:hypothetical protein